MFVCTECVCMHMCAVFGDSSAQLSIYIWRQQFDGKWLPLLISIFAFWDRQQTLLQNLELTDYVYQLTMLRCSWLCTEVLEFMCTSLYPDFYMDTEDLNLGPFACAIRTLPNNQTPEFFVFQNLFLFKGVSFNVNIICNIFTLSLCNKSLFWWPAPK